MTQDLRYKIQVFGSITPCFSHTVHFILRFAFCFLCITSCILILACGSDPKEGDLNLTSEESIKDGWEQYKAGKYELAIQAFERVLNRKDENNISLLADANNGLGWAYMGFSGGNVPNQNYMARGLEKFHEAIKLDNTNADAWVGKACILIIRRNSQDELNEAINAIDSALKANSTYMYRHDYDSVADIYALKAQSYYYLGDLEKARSEVDKVLAIEKDNDAALAMKQLLAD